METHNKVVRWILRGVFFSFVLGYLNVALPIVKEVYQTGREIVNMVLPDAQRVMDASLHNMRGNRPYW